MISDLSPGDRLSLKGKLFELQRKLNLIDLEHKLDEQYPYKPTILEYDLPNRIPANFVENSNKAEIIRKQKKKMLAESLQSQTDESCTFQPRIYTQPKQFHFDNRPVHIRLSEKGKEYQDHLERRKQQSRMYDDRGRRLFTPKINQHRPATSLNTSGINTVDNSIIMEGNPQFMSPESNGYHDQYQTSQFPVPTAQSTNTISAEEYLYQDAKDRETRLLNLVSSYEDEIRQSANGTKINSTSKKMLLQKADRHTRHVFSLIDKNGDNIVSYEDVSLAMEKYKLFSNQEHLIKSKELFWEVIDHHKHGMVERVDFQDITIPFLLQKNVNNVVPAIQKKELSRLQQQQQLEISVNGDESKVHDVVELGASSLPFLKEKDLQEFRDILMKFIDAAERKKIHDRNKRIEARNNASSIARKGDIVRKGGGGIVTNHSNADPEGSPENEITGMATIENDSSAEEQEDNFEFKPKIHPYSFKLAQKKVKKDLALLAGLMSTSSVKATSTSAQGGRNMLQPGSVSQNNTIGIAEETPTKDIPRSEVPDSSPPPPPPPNCEEVMLGGELDEDQYHDDSQPFEEEEKLNSSQQSVATGLGSNSVFVASPESGVTHYELMHARALLSRQKREQLKTSIMQRELEKCTFQPKLVTKGVRRSRSFDPQSAGSSVGNGEGCTNIDELSMTSEQLHHHDENDMEREGNGVELNDFMVEQQNDHTFTSPSAHSRASTGLSRSFLATQHSQPPVHERLYALQSKKGATSTLDNAHQSTPPPSYIQELQACSFKPKIGPQPPSNIKAQLVSKINGTEKTIQRMKEFHEKKQKAKEEEENAWKQLDANYQKSRNLLKNKMIPFQSNLEERRKAKKEKELEKQKQHEKDNPGSPSAPHSGKDEFIVNVKVSVNKSAKIRVCRGDEPAELAHRFGMIYALDAAAVQVLSTVLYESMVQHKFVSKPEESPKAPPSPAKEETASQHSRHSTPSSSKHGSHGKVVSNRRSIRRSFLEQTAEALFGGNPFTLRPQPSDDDMEEHAHMEGDGIEGEENGEPYEGDDVAYDDGEDGEDYSTFRSQNSQSDGSYLDDGEDEEHSFEHPDDEGEEEVYDINHPGTSDSDISNGYQRYRLYGDDGPRDGKKKKSVIADLL